MLTFLCMEGLFEGRFFLRILWHAMVSVVNLVEIDDGFHRGEIQ